MVLRLHIHSASGPVVWVLVCIHVVVIHVLSFACHSSNVSSYESHLFPVTFMTDVSLIWHNDIMEYECI